MLFCEFDGWPQWGFKSHFAGGQWSRFQVLDNHVDQFAVGKVHAQKLRPVVLALFFPKDPQNPLLQHDCVATAEEGKLTKTKMVTDTVS